MRLRFCARASINDDEDDEEEDAGCAHAYGGRGKTREVICHNYAVIKGANQALNNGFQRGPRRQGAAWVRAAARARPARPFLFASRGRLIAESLWRTARVAKFLISLGAAASSSALGLLLALIAARTVS